MSVKQLALLSHYLHLKHVSETVGLTELLLTPQTCQWNSLTELLLTPQTCQWNCWPYWVTTYTLNMSVKQLALLSYYLHLQHVSETASLSKVLPTPQTCQRTSWPGYPRFKLVWAVGTLQPVDAQVRQLVVPQLGSAGGHKVAVFARELDVLMLTLDVAAKVLSCDGPEGAVRTPKWSIPWEEAGWKRAVKMYLQHQFITVCVKVFWYSHGNNWVNIYVIMFWNTLC